MKRPDHRVLRAIGVDSPPEDLGIDVVDGDGGRRASTGESRQKVRTSREIPEKSGRRTRGGITMVPDDVAPRVDARGRAEVAQDALWLSGDPEDRRLVRARDDRIARDPSVDIDGQSLGLLHLTVVQADERVVRRARRPEQRNGRVELQIVPRQVLVLGDRRGAKQMYMESLDICHHIGDRSKAAGNLAGLGSVMRTAGEVELAAKYENEAISEFEQIGDHSSAAEVETELSALFVDQGKPLEAESLARKATDEFRKEKSPRDEALASAVLARALLDQGKIADAGLVTERALVLSQKYQHRDAELAVSVTAARVRAAAGNPNDRENANSELRQIVADAQRIGFMNYALEARLALGEIEVSSGNFPNARRELEALRRDANQIGYGLVAQQAASALKRVSSQQPGNVSLR